MIKKEKVPEELNHFRISLILSVEMIFLEVLTLASSRSISACLRARIALSSATLHSSNSALSADTLRCAKAY